MILEVQKIAQLTSGVLSPAEAQGTVSGISTDTRTLSRGDLYIPLRGERFDGHEYLSHAVRKGASAVLSEDPVAGLPIPVILVRDTMAALGDLAAGLRQGLNGPMVAVTGSSGKTTTKEMLSAILQGVGPGLKTSGNFNNLVGLPLTVFRLESAHRWAVLEMGMSARGEIARLSEIAQPNIGIITNIGPAHLQDLGSLDGVARAKGELFAALPKGGTAIINADDERVARLPVANGVQRLFYGVSAEAAVRAEDIVCSGEIVSFTLVTPKGAIPVQLPVPGRFNVSNALAAAAAASVLEVPLELIAQGLQSFQLCRGRMELIDLPGGVTVLEDTYNANPLSVRAALTALDELSVGGRRIAVLGDMKELGDTAADLHRQVGAFAAGKLDLLLAMGELAGEVVQGARGAGLAEHRSRVVASHEEAVRCLKKVLRKGDRVLIKGSRSMHMERVLEILRGQTLRAVANHG